MEKQKVKNVHMKVAGRGKNEKLQTIAIEPGVTMADVRRKLKLGDNFETFRLDSDTPIPNNADLYTELNEGEKIVISPVSVVGLNPLSYFFKRKSKSKRTKHSKKKMRVISSANLDPIRIKHIGSSEIKVRPETQETELLVIKPQKISTASRYEKLTTPPIRVTPAENEGIEAELQNMGWKKAGSCFYGWFKDMNGNRYHGCLIRSWGKNFDAYIGDLPSCVLNGPHRLCFLRQSNGWFSVHFRKKGNHPISLIKGVERCINDSLQRDGFQRGLHNYQAYLPPDIGTSTNNHRLESFASDESFNQDIITPDRSNSFYNPTYDQNKRRARGDALW